MQELVKVTKWHIDNAITKNGGWTMRQIEAVGLEWPPKRGWRDEIIGKEITQDNLSIFLGRNNYKDQLKDSRWTDLRASVLERDEYRCQVCDSRNKNLHVHHKRYISNMKAWEYDMKLLITLCSSCHEKFHHKDIKKKKKSKKAPKIFYGYNTTK